MTTARKKTNKQPKIVKSDIFSLYTHEKIVSIKDDSGREVKILFVKPTQGERQKLLETYVTILADVRDEYLGKDKETGYYTRTINTLGKAHLIEGILNYQKAQRGELIDLYPLPDNISEMGEDKQKEFQDELIKKWEKGRLEDLEKMSLADLRKELANITIEGLSLIESGRKFDFLSLHMMCLDPETKDKIFKTPEDVERVRDRRIIDFLLEELTTFRSAESMTEVRKTAEHSDFLASGESQKS